MSTEYKEESRRKTEKKTSELLTSAPAYVKAFYAHMQGGHREALTLYAYIRDVLEFLSYEQDILPERYGTAELSDFPVELLSPSGANDHKCFRKTEAFRAFRIFPVSPL